MKKSLVKVLLIVLLYSLAFLGYSIKAYSKNSLQKSGGLSKEQAAEKYLQRSQDTALNQALLLAKQGQNLQAATNLFNLTKRSELIENRSEIRFTLGKLMMDLGLNQVAAWQFVDVIKSGDPRFLKKAVQSLLIAADELGDDTILNYAVSRIAVDDFPEEHKDMLYFRVGEIKQKNKEYAPAIEAFEKVSSSSRYFAQARYSRALCFAEMNDTDSAIKAFKELYASRLKFGPTDDTRVIALAGLARTYYQKKDWDQSIEYYRKIPRDHVVWHEALFESSWAYLRAARFRSALGNFHSLHSTFYEDFFVPESLLLRSIVYLYICKPDEVEKVLGLFERTYGPARARMTEFLESSRDPAEYYSEIEKALLVRKDLILDRPITKGRLPYNVVRYIIGRADVSKDLDYMRKLIEEKRKIENLSSNFASSGLGKYSIKVLSNRIKNTKSVVADQMKDHLIKMRAELRDLYEQANFLRYEMINAKKEQIQKEISGKTLPESKIDDNNSRDYYVKNGYDYWPFLGEFWLDEIGNFFYLGKSSCE
jgi:tetratricopeptide (TPR) repeat protein